jgi:hypothetical protein
LCPSIFREIWRHCNGAPLLCPINATSSKSHCCHGNGVCPPCFWRHHWRH